VNIFNSTHNELEKMGFTINKKVIEEIKSIGCTVYSNSNFNVLVKFFANPSEEIIREESIQLRENLFYLNYNVWNSYFLVCVEDTVSKDFTYVLEKETKGIRKYVVKNVKDFDRIPIFNKLDTSSIFNIDFYAAERDKNVMNILELIKKNNGLETKFTNQVVEDIVQKITTEEKKFNEY